MILLILKRNARHNEVAVPHVNPRSFSRTKIKDSRQNVSSHPRSQGVSRFRVEINSSRSVEQNDFRTLVARRRETKTIVFVASFRNEPRPKELSARPSVSARHEREGVVVMARTVTNPRVSGAFHEGKVPIPSCQRRGRRVASPTIADKERRGGGGREKKQIAAFALREDRVKVLGGGFRGGGGGGKHL
jgi:hypothetical protein